jgi:hypothetical protein
VFDALGYLLDPGGANAGKPIRHVYFPTTSIAALICVMEAGASAEIAIVGNDGILAAALFMGGESTPSRTVVQSAGEGCRLKAQLRVLRSGRSGNRSSAAARRHAVTAPTRPAVVNLHTTAPTLRRASNDSVRYRTDSRRSAP